MSFGVVRLWNFAMIKGASHFLQQMVGELAKRNAAFFLIESVPKTRNQHFPGALSLSFSDNTWNMLCALDGRTCA